MQNFILKPPSSVKSLYISIMTVSNQNISSLHPCANNMNLIFLFSFGGITFSGVFLPKLCEAQGKGARRRMSEIKSSGYVAPAPLKSVAYLAAPLSAPPMAPY